MSDAAVVVMGPGGREKHVAGGHCLLCDNVYGGTWRGAWPEVPALSNWSKADVTDFVTTSDGMDSKMKRRLGEKIGGKEKGWAEKLTATRCTVSNDDGMTKAMRVPQIVLGRRLGP